MNRTKARQIGLEMRDRLALSSWNVKVVTGTRRRLGQTDFNRCVITLTGWYVDLNDEDEVRDTIAHEFAHVMAGPGHGHDRVWKQWAIKLGATPRAKAKGINSLPPRLVATCEYCDAKFYRERQPRTNRLCRCTRGMPRRPVLVFVPYRPAAAAARLRGDDPSGHVGKTNQALTALLQSLREAQESGDRARGRQVRAQLRRMGHRGGLRSTRGSP